MRQKFTPEHRDQLHNQTRAQLRHSVQHAPRSPPRPESIEPPALTRREARAQPRDLVAAPKHLVLTGAMALAAPVIIAVALATSGTAADASGSAAPAASTPSASVTTAARVATPEPTVRSMVATDSVTPIPPDGTSTGPVTGGTVVTLTGTDLDTVATVTFGANAGTVISSSQTTVTLETPASTDFGPGDVPVELLNTAGTPIAVPEGASPTASKDSDPAATADPAASAVSDPLTFSYVPDPRITAQIDYVNAHWTNYNAAEYGSLRGNDCVNFASQSLIQRGWTMDAEWNFDLASNNYSPAWASSTALAAYLTAHPERATPLTDQQRDQVKVGDVVQFDWDRSGDRDHTGIITGVTKTDAGVTIQYAGHTFDTIDKSVDESLANSGGTVSYFSVQ